MLKRYCASVFLAILPGVTSANVITNGGFEEFTLVGWTCTGTISCLSESFGSPLFVGPVDGLRYLSVIDNEGFATISQTFATDFGTSYDFSFFSAADQDDAGNILRYSFGGAPITAIRTLSMTETAGSFVAASSSTTLSFFVETDPGTGTWGIDAVSVTRSPVQPPKEMPAVPLPASLPFLLFGCAGLLGLKRRKTKA